MATFMGKDPKTSGDQTRPEGIQRPQRKLARAVKDRVWELDDLGMDTTIEESGGLVDSSQGSKIRDAEGTYASESTCQRTREKRRTRRGMIATRFA